MSGARSGTAGEEGWKRQEVAGSCWALRHEVVDLSDQGLFCLGILVG